MANCNHTTRRDLVKAALAASTLIGAHTVSGFSALAVKHRELMAHVGDDQIAWGNTVDQIEAEMMESTISSKADAVAALRVVSDRLRDIGADEFETSILCNIQLFMEG